MYIEEQYVSFETAKLLKEKGFDVFGDGSYGSETEIHREYSPFGKIRDISTSRPSEKGYPAPSQQMAMRWLREVHTIDITIEITIIGARPRNYYCSIWDKNNQNYILDVFDTYEDACETAILYCLTNLI